MTRLTFSIIFCWTVTFCFGQSQRELNEDAAKDYQKADKELNNVFQEILKEYKKDTAFIKNLKVAQKIWVQFRDAETKAKYPDREDGYYGSVQPMCWYLYKTELTEERLKKLKVWLTGIEEGDVCSGSVKRKN
jgi:uncharacterized protein YecT (DUF1311 family)